MGNKDGKDTRGVPLELGGRPRIILFTTRALRTFEERLKLNALQEFRNLSMTGFVGLLWAGLLHEEPELELSQVEEWLDAADFREVDRALGQAFRQAFRGGEGPITPGQAAPQVPGRAS